MRFGKTSIKMFWDLTQLVREEMNIDLIESFVNVHFYGCGYNVYKTCKDEVLQVYDDDNCYTIIGGSSADKKEWKSNFNAFPLADKLIHRGFFNGANEVVTSKSFVRRENMTYIGHSRGGAIASVLSYIEHTSRSIGFGSPKAFKKKVENDFFNVRNPLDPVVHVVPFFKTCGDVLPVKFRGKRHTGYGDHLPELAV